MRVPSAAIASAAWAGLFKPNENPALFWLACRRLKNVSIPKSLSGGVRYAIQPLTNDGSHVHLQQKIASTTEIEAEMHLAPRQPGNGGGYQIGQAEEDAEDTDAEDHGDLQAAKVEHGRKNNS